MLSQFHFDDMPGGSPTTLETVAGAFEDSISVLARESSASLVVVSALLAFLGFVWFAVARKRQQKTVLQVLRGDKELSLFYDYWRLMKSGAWDRPRLDGGARDHASFVVFAFTNAALQGATGHSILSLEPNDWRRFLISHVAVTELTPAQLLEMSRNGEHLESCTGCAFPLQVLSSEFTDGSLRFEEPIRASNGYVFKVRRLVPAEELLARLGKKTD